MINQAMALGTVISFIFYEMVGLSPEGCGLGLYRLTFKSILESINYPYHCFRDSYGILLSSIFLIPKQGSKNDRFYILSTDHNRVHCSIL